MLYHIFFPSTIKTIVIMTLKEFRIWTTTILIDIAFHVCPEGKFKIMFANFLTTNLKKLHDGNWNGIDSSSAGNSDKKKAKAS